MKLPTLILLSLFSLPTFAVPTACPTKVGPSCGTAAKMCEGTIFLGCQTVPSDLVVGNFNGITYSVSPLSKIPGYVRLQNTFNPTTGTSFLSTTYIKSPNQTCISRIPATRSGRIYKLSTNQFAAWEYVAGSTTTIDTSRYSIISISDNKNQMYLTMLSGDQLTSGISDIFYIMSVQLSSPAWTGNNILEMLSSYYC